MKPDFPTIGSQLDRSGVDRRDFLGFCSRLMVAAPFGLALTNFRTPEAVAAEVAAAKRPSVIWLHFQDCTGCSETLLRTSQPDVAELLFHVISLDYHETLMAASGVQAEKSLHDAMHANDGRYILVVEGSIPEKDQGIYMKLAGKPAIDVLRECAKGAAAIVAIGSCASWGGVPSTAPNPTAAYGVERYVRDKPLVTIPGCPPNPYILLNVILQYARYAQLPELDALKRPKFAFDRVIHEHCPRRPHFDAGEFASAFGDENHRKGYCLYKLGCKGPVTHASCSTRHFNEVEGVWPIGIGAPCIGCTEQETAFKTPLFDVVQLHRATPPSTYPPITSPQGVISPIATAIVGAGAGILVGAGYVASKKVPASEAEAARTTADDAGGDR
ncbi:hydrogenase small subunit [Myxococcota bacterium]|nr:hydrogenase small subunit [Myxococcota bacterium]